MTPAEINGRIRAFNAQNQADTEGLDLLAWLIGNYTAYAYNAPKKYPNKPRMIKKQPRLPEDEMPNETMKEVLTGFAKIHNAIEEQKQ